jgi:hypothetical protein
MMSIGFVASRVDEGLFVLQGRENDGILVAVVVLYVSDLLIIANEGSIGQIKDEMMQRCWMHDLGSVSFRLGMKIEHNREHHTIDIHQHRYIWTILAKFSMGESRPVATPMAMKLHRRTPEQDACDPTTYELMIGGLLYAVTAIGTNISYAIGVLRR